jgi:hypothetical protein
MPVSCLLLASFYIVEALRLIYTCRKVLVIVFLLHKYFFLTSLIHLLGIGSMRGIEFEAIVVSVKRRTIVVPGLLAFEILV